MSTSVYLMKFRVVAQAAVVCTLGAGIAYSMFSDYVMPKLQHEEKKNWLILKAQNISFIHVLLNQLATILFVDAIFISPLSTKS